MDVSTAVQNHKFTCVQTGKEIKQHECRVLNPSTCKHFNECEIKKVREAMQTLKERGLLTRR